MWHSRVGNCCSILLQLRAIWPTLLHLLHMGIPSIVRRLRDEGIPVFDGLFVRCYKLSLSPHFIQTNLAIISVESLCCRGNCYCAANLEWVTLNACYMRPHLVSSRFCWAIFGVLIDTASLRLARFSASAKLFGCPKITWLFKLGRRP